MIKYKARFNIGHLILTIIFLLYFLITAYTSYKENHDLSSIIDGTIWFLVSFSLLLFLIIKFTYIKINNNELTYVLSLLQRHKIDIRKIIEIKNEPMFPILGKSIPSLGLVYRKDNGGVDIIKINPNPFPQKKIKEFVVELVRLNKNIKIDSYWEKK